MTGPRAELRCSGSVTVRAEGYENEQLIQPAGGPTGGDGDYRVRQPVPSTRLAAAFSRSPDCSLP